MGRNRDIHLFRIQHNTKTPEEFLKALADSPYRTHRRMAVALSSSILNSLAEPTQDNLAEAKEPNESHSEAI